MILLIHHFKLTGVNIWPTSCRLFTNTVRDGAYDAEAVEGSGEKHREKRERG